MLRKLKNPPTLKTTHIIIASFALTILLGSLLLMLPITHASNTHLPFIDALFTATTSTCVTGLVTVTPATTFNTLGHVIILILIQLGGLGVLTSLFAVTLIFNKHLGLSNRLLLQDALNITDSDETINFIKKMILWTFVVEGIGALCYLPAFIPEYGIKGIWYSIFTAVSAFCNAGIDIIKPNSLCDYITNPIINLTTCSLVILSSLGYIVWFDVAKNFANRKTKAFRFRNFSLHSKIVIVSTGILLTVGTLSIFIFEYSNLDTIGDLNFIQKLQASFFQSVTCRTAGFVTIPQENLTESSVLVSMVLMFIGGSPVGTAGGVKTVTMAILITSALATLRNQDNAELFNRRISKQSISKAVAVIFISLSIVLTSTLIVSACTNFSLLDILYETVSACATVGVTRGITPYLPTLAKLVVILTMFLGRVGPISLIIAFNTNKEYQQVVQSPEEEIYVG